MKRSEIVHIRHGSEFLGNIAPALIEQAGEKAVIRQLEIAPPWRRRVSWHGVDWAGVVDSDAGPWL
ncbi:MAG: hypothetical protein JO232_20620 [Verrucomicrobia bacterium]|nr:hypothetical protein [Verrucomicrobiota bacterium]